uniref:Uncharacterized protein n=1 Tax=Oryza sativa subsp. indica TaxID=39946 RepID=Q0P172_ORYSI|nr:hypothetical protein TQR14A11.10 [Oryza sativa Indica Group]
MCVIKNRRHSGSNGERWPAKRELRHSAEEDERTETREPTSFELAIPSAPPATGERGREREASGGGERERETSDDAGGDDGSTCGDGGSARGDDGSTRGDGESARGDHGSERGDDGSARRSPLTTHWAGVGGGAPSAAAPSSLRSPSDTAPRALLATATTSRHAKGLKGGRGWREKVAAAGGEGEEGGGSGCWGGRRGRRGSGGRERPRREARRIGLDA